MDSGHDKPPRRPNDLQPYNHLQQYWPGIALAAGIVAWVLLYDRAYRPQTTDLPPAAPSVLLLYASIIAIGLGTTELVRRHHGWRGTTSAGRFLTAGAVLVWGYYETYESKWRSDSVRYTDTHGRWSQRLVYRRMDYYNSEDAAAKDELRFKEDFSLEGRMAGTGKPHGPWKWQLGLDHWDDAIKNHEPYQKTVFYWYGDEVSEGDWHLRNR